MTDYFYLPSTYKRRNKHIMSSTNPADVDIVALPPTFANTGFITKPGAYVYPGTFSAIGAASPGAYLAPPRDLKDLESRRRTWWMTIMFDRIASVGGWVHGIDERDIGTEMPLRRIDFENEVCSAVSKCGSITHHSNNSQHWPHCRTIPRICTTKASLYNIHHSTRTRSSFS